MSNHLDLNRSIRKAAWWLVGFYSITLVSVVVGTCWMSVSFHSRLARSIALGVRNSLLVGDLRQGVLFVEKAGKENFNSIEFYRPDGSHFFSLFDSALVEQPTWFTKDESITFSSMGTGSKEQEIGRLSFRYSLRSPLTCALGLWALCLALAFPLYLRIKAVLIARHDEILVAKESELAAQVALQVSHDIRSPVTALNLLVRQLDDISVDKRILLESVADRINSIANDLLEKYRTNVNPRTRKQVLVHSQSVKLNVESVILKDLILDLFEEKKIELSGNPKVSIELDIQGAEISRCVIDKKELMRACSNLINNSVDAIESKGKITLAIRSTSKTITVGINDNGKGIPPHILNRLGKERLSHGKESFQQSGSGVGVLHAKSIVEEMGGSFAIRSKVGVGTLVFLEFPLAEAELKPEISFRALPIQSQS